MNDLKKLQAPMSIDEQINNLLELGLKIDDVEHAKKILKEISYYRLIKAYSITLKKDGRYIEGVKLTDIIDLYNFNKELRILIFQLVEYIEISLRANISNHLSLKYGSIDYTNPSNYDNPTRQIKVINKIKKQIKRNSKSPFIKNFLENYDCGEIPFYAAVEVITFGTLSKFYKNMKEEDKIIIASYYNIKRSYFESFIENFSYLRNICAHYGRLYNVKILKSPKLYRKYKKQNISNNTLFASILSLKIVSNPDIYDNFYSKFLNLLNKYKIVNVKDMGFPDNWMTLLKS